MIYLFSQRNNFNPKESYFNYYYDNGNIYGYTSLNNLNLDFIGTCWSVSSNSQDLSKYNEKHVILNEKEFILENDTNTTAGFNILIEKYILLKIIEKL